MVAASRRSKDKAEARIGNSVKGDRDFSAEVLKASKCMPSELLTGLLDLGNGLDLTTEDGRAEYVENFENVLVSSEYYEPIESLADIKRFIETFAGVKIQKNSKGKDDANGDDTHETDDTGTPSNPLEVSEKAALEMARDALKAMVTGNIELLAALVEAEKAPTKEQALVIMGKAYQGIIDKQAMELAKAKEDLMHLKTAKAPRAPKAA